MYYHRHNNRTDAPSVKKLVIAVSGLVLLFFSGPTFFHAVSSFSNPITAPFLRLGASVNAAAGSLFPFFKTNKALIEENASLKNALGDANGKLLTYTLLEEENKALKESFGRATNEKKILAAILAKPSRSPYDTFIIDAGFREGIAKGDLVTAFETVAIGSIAEVFPHTAKVMLFSSPEQKTAVRLESSHITKEIIGQGGGVFVFSLPRDIAVVRGEMLSLPGINQKIVGTVTNTQMLPDDSFQTVTAKLPINIFELERVFVTFGNDREKL